jgi:hypothetical protein
MTDNNKQGIRISVITSVLGWVITFGTAVAYVSNYSATSFARLDFIEKEISSLDARLDASESFRVTIATDLLWIRRALQDTSR